MQERSNYLRFVGNSILLAVGVPRWSACCSRFPRLGDGFAPGKRTKDLLLWMLSTR